VGDVPLRLLRPALELAWAVAKQGEAATPVVAAPGPMRRLLGFARLPDRALATVRASVESDDRFRERVAGAADETALERASWLWLRRPEGWAAELDELTQRAHDEASAREEQAAERRASRQLAAAETALRRSEAELAVAQAALDERRREADEHRRGRRLAERATRDLRRALDASEAATREAEARAISAEAELAALQEELDAHAASVPAMDAGAQARAADAASSVRIALAAAQQLAEALADAARALTADAGGDPDATPRAEVPPGQAPAPRSRLRRRPVPLPGGVFDDSVEAAAFLMRVPKMVLVVDGYNVTLRTWAGEGIADQRHRLVHALAELAMRTTVTVRVIFDGHPDEEYPPVPGRARRAVRVVFSPAGIDADEEIIDAVTSLSAAQPVTVATDDRRVRDEVMARGANVISAAQLLGVLGRAPQ
jgi:predicted RNA-binding protein with PIN domain